MTNDVELNHINTAQMVGELSTTAKCTIRTSKGVLEVELWAKECPITVKSFLQSAMSNEWDSVMLSRFEGGTLYANKNVFNCAREFHPKLRFNRRALVGIFPESNKMFFTVEARPEYDDRAVLFGAVVGNSWYTLVCIADGEVEDDGSTFVYPARVERIEVMIPYFNELQRLGKRSSEGKEEIRHIKAHKKARKVEIEYEEEGDEEEENLCRIKIRAAHDVLKDKRLAKGSVQGCGVEAYEERVEADEQRVEARESQENKGRASANVVEDIEEPTDRERETLSILHEFLSDRKGKNPIFK